MCGPATAYLSDARAHSHTSKNVPLLFDVTYIINLYLIYFVASEMANAVVFASECHCGTSEQEAPVIHLTHNATPLPDTFMRTQNMCRLWRSDVQRGTRLRSQTMTTNNETETERTRM